MLALQENGSLSLKSTNKFIIFCILPTLLESCTTHTVIDHAALQINLLSSYLVVSMEDNSHLRQSPLP